MGIDPSILLGVRPPQIQQTDPLDRFSKLLALKNAQTQGDAQDRGLADEEAVRSAYQQSGGDPARLRALLTQGGQYKPLQALDKFELERRDKEASIAAHQASAGKSNYDVEKDKVERTSALLSVARDQPTWDAVRRVMIVQNPQVAEHLPLQYDKTFIDTQIAQGQTITQRLDDQRKREATAETARGHTLTAERSAEANRIAGERLALEQNQPRGVYDAERGVVVDPRNATATPVTVAGGAPLAAKVPESSKRESAAIDAQANTINKALEYVKATPDAFGLTRGAATAAGAVPEALAMRASSTEANQARAFVYNVVSKVINERAGAAQSKQELARLRGFLPSEFDNAKTITDKLEGFKSFLAEQKKAFVAQPAGVAPVQDGTQQVRLPPPPNLGERQGGYIYKGGDPANPKSWEKA